MDEPIQMKFVRPMLTEMQMVTLRTESKAEVAICQPWIEIH